MNNGVILSFLMELYRKLSEFFAFSTFKKITDYLKNILAKITRNSFLVNYFKTESRFNEKLKNSIIYKIFAGVFSFIAKAFSPIGKYVKQSLIVNAANYVIDGIFHFSIRIYGLIVICMVTAYSILSFLTGGFTRLMAVIALALAVISGICLLIDKSICVLLKNSSLTRLALKLIDVEDFCGTPQINTTKKMTIVCILLGVVSGIAAFFISPLYFMIAVIGVCGVSIVLKNYRLGVYFSVIALPFLPTMGLVGLVLISMTGFVLRLLFDENVKYKSTVLDVPIIIFSVVMMLSTFTSFTFLASAKVLLVYLAFISSYYLITNTFDNKKQVYIVISLMLFAGFFVALYGIYQYIFGFKGANVWIDNDMFSEIETRVISTFANPNVLGEYLLLIIPIGIALGTSAPKNYNKFVHIVMVGFLTICMIFTFSRGNWIGLLLAVFMYFIFYDRRFIYLGIIALLLAPLVMPQTIMDRFLSVGDKSDSSTSYRVYIWMGTLKMIKDYWMCGIGLGESAFNSVYPLYSYSGIIAPHSHNLYLQIIVENGILGIAAFLGIIISYFKMAISSIINVKRGYIKALLVGLISGMLGYLLQGMFDNAWYNYRIVMLFFVILAVTASLVNIAKKETGDSV